MRGMKIAAVLLCVALLVSCSAKTEEVTAPASEEITLETAKKTENVLSHFKGYKSLDEVLKEASEVDFYLQPDFSGLKKKTEKDDESATAIDYYYSGDTLVYADYSGYGEDAFEYYCTSKNGSKFKVMYVDDAEGQRDYLSVEAEDYSVSFDALDKEAKYGANQITVSIFNKAENDFSSVLNYVVEGENAYVSSAKYYDESGYHKYTAYLEEDGNFTEDNKLVFAKKNSVKPYSKLKAICQDTRVKELDLLIGSGSFVYTESESGEKTWFYKGSAYTVFSDRYKASDFAKAYAGKAKQDDIDGDFWIVEIKNEYFEFSSSFEDFYAFADSDVDDYYYQSVKTDKNGAIKALESSELSYY